MEKALAQRRGRRGLGRHSRVPSQRRARRKAAALHLVHANTNETAIQRFKQPHETLGVLFPPVSSHKTEAKANAGKEETLCQSRLTPQGKERKVRKEKCFDRRVVKEERKERRGEAGIRCEKGG